jgi:DNA-binding NarL/FixJ family response regulator
MAEKKERVILVVDDNADHLNGFRILLVRFDDARLEHADVDGFEVLRVVRSKHPELKVVVVSGFLQGSMNKAAKALGALVTLDKDVAADSLLTVVDGLLEHSK